MKYGVGMGEQAQLTIEALLKIYHLDLGTEVYSIWKLHNQCEEDAYYADQKHDDPSELGLVAVLPHEAQFERNAK